MPNKPSTHTDQPVKKNADKPEVPVTPEPSPAIPPQQPPAAPDHWYVDPKLPPEKANPDSND